jgi:hypothetical protein
MAIVIKTHGKYYYKTENIKGEKSFSQEVKAPSLEFFNQTTSRYCGTDDDGKPKFRDTSFLNVRGMLKKRILPMLLPSKYSDFVRVKSVTVDEIITDDGAHLELPLNLQSRVQLVRYCRLKRIPIDAENYLNIDELRSDITEYETDPAMFAATTERREKIREEEKKFLQLNNLVELNKVPVLPNEKANETEEATPSIEPDSAPTKKSKKKTVDVLDL